jgi:hypothetical protein
MAGSFPGYWKGFFCFQFNLSIAVFSASSKGVLPIHESRRLLVFKQYGNYLLITKQGTTNSQVPLMV